MEAINNRAYQAEFRDSRTNLIRKERITLEEI